MDVRSLEHSQSCLEQLGFDVRRGLRDIWPNPDLALSGKPYKHGHRSNGWIHLLNNQRRYIK